MCVGTTHQNTYKKWVNGAVYMKTEVASINLLNYQCSFSSDRVLHAMQGYKLRYKGEAEVKGVIIMRA